ncbi:MAG: hypothetical protein NWF04_10265 [Candidatus Bathyarchaeota archaeon]|nr:hypothetical protein [Candidatus Bathyarchaeota archaeon]
MRKSVFLKLGVLLFCMLIFSAPSNVGNHAVEDASYTAVYDDLYVVVHLNDDLEPELIHQMLDELEVVTGVQLCVWVGDNNTGAIWDAKGRLERWLPEFTQYKVVIQCDYAFEQKYGYYERPFWKYNSTATLSPQWYQNWYGNLSQTLGNYSNVVLMVGFNEPYNHFTTKALAQQVLKTEYQTWKNLSSIPFSTEFLMPYKYWADHWNFPLDPSTENDCVPYWANYSDYIGINLWVDNVPPQYQQTPGAYQRMQAVINMCEYYSNLLDKPIHVNEFPAWDPQTLAYLANKTMQSPNIGQIYQLWYWSNQEDPHIDGWSYGLYTINPNTHQTTPTQISYDTFKQTLNPHPNP